MKTKSNAPNNIMLEERGLLSPVIDLKQRLESGLLFPSFIPEKWQVQDCLSPCLYCSIQKHLPLPTSAYLYPICSLPLCHCEIQNNTRFQQNKKICQKEAVKQSKICLPERSRMWFSWHVSTEVMTQEHFLLEFLCSMQVPEAWSPVS